MRTLIAELERLCFMEDEGEDPNTRAPLPSVNEALLGPAAAALTRISRARRSSPRGPGAGGA